MNTLLIRSNFFTNLRNWRKTRRTNIYKIQQTPYNLISNTTFPLETINEFRNPVFYDIKRRIYSFERLSKNWDSYNADQISKDSILNAVALLELLETHNIHVDYAFPMRDGGVQLEIIFKKYDVEIEVYNENEFNLLIFNNECVLTFEKKYRLSSIEQILTDLIKYSG